MVAHAAAANAPLVTIEVRLSNRTLQTMQMEPGAMLSRVRRQLTSYDPFQERLSGLRYDERNEPDVPVGSLAFNGHLTLQVVPR